MAKYGVCAQLCTAGVTALRIGDDIVVPLYSEVQTMPFIGIDVDGMVCYDSLGIGAASGALNVTYDGATYHSIN